MIVFANLGPGLKAPVSGPNGLLGSGYYAQLAFSDGISIGGLAPFLAEGYFSGGATIVPGVLPGERVELVVLVYDEFGLIGQSGPVIVSVGGCLCPISEPSIFKGLKSFEVFLKRYPEGYYWDAQVSGGTCFNSEGIVAAPCHCNRDELGRPLAVETEACESLPPESVDFPKRVQFRVLETGTLELRWPTRYRLARSREPGGEISFYPRSEGIQNGFHLLEWTPAAPQAFFWLE